MGYESHLNNIEILENLLEKINKVIIEYNRTLLIGDRDAILSYESRIKKLFDVEGKFNVNEFLKSKKGNIQWHIVRLNPGRKFND